MGSGGDLRFGAGSYCEAWKLTILSGYPLSRPYCSKHTLPLWRMLVHLARQLRYLAPAAIAQRLIEEAQIPRALLRVARLVHAHVRNRTRLP